jgi:ABC-type multidrug transport system fused ATPase/permease subunit
MKYIYCSVIVLFFSFQSFGDGFTQADRERMIRTEVTLQEFMKSTEKRFEINDKRFEDMNNRLQDMNNRLQDVNNRLQDMNSRLESFLQVLIIAIGVFATVSGGIFVYVIWDRRSFLSASIQNAKEIMDEKLAIVEKEGKLNDLIKAMRDLAEEDSKVKAVLSKFHLL